MYLCFRETIYELKFTLFYLFQLVIILYTIFKVFISSEYTEFKIISSLIKLQFLLAGIALFIL